MAFPKGNLSTPTAILIGAVVVSVSILISGGVIKLKGFNTAPTTSTITGTQATPEPVAAGPVKVTIDDDPQLGEKSAPLTLVEFSDYECPFCKKYFDETYSKLKKDYIDTGKVKLVYRDFPLSFHQNANKEAQAANCAREQGGDSAYFKFHDEIFKRTTSNGTGLALDQLPVIATSLGLSSQALQQCLDADKYKAEVAQDIEDGNTAGVDSTPSFILGKFDSSGNFESVRGVADTTYPKNVIFLYDANGKQVGVKIAGAFPYSNFQTYIDSLLK